MATTRTTKASRDERDKIIKLKHKFQIRISIAKHGKAALDAGNYAAALKYFTEYLSIMSEIKEVKDYHDLKVHMFDPKKDLTEIFMISQILFEMARLYDAVPKFQPESQKCLDLFLHFTTNQPFQVVNSEMVRKALKRSAFKNPDMFRNSYQQIFVQSKKCYIVTFCYGEDHEITKECRKFKDWLLTFDSGQPLVRTYYVMSSRAIPACEKYFFLRSITQFIAKPILLLFSKFLLPVIIKKC